MIRGIAIFLIIIGFACQRGPQQGNTSLDDRLLFAIDSENLSLLDSCLQHGADVNARDHFGATALILAVNKGNRALVEKLLDAGADVNLARSQYYKSTPLMETAPKNDTVIAKLLLEKGASVEPRDSFGDTALNWAAYYGHQPLAKLLLDHGARWDVDSQNGTAIDLAMKQWHDAVTEFFIQKGAGEPIKSKEQKQLITAVKRGTVNEVQDLLKEGITPDSKDELGTPALVIAASKGQGDIILALLAAGAEINATNRVGQTALSRAAFFGHNEILALLLAHGADPNTAGGRYKLTPLLSAATSGEVLAGGQLLNAGAHINAQEGVTGYTPLMIATAYGHYEFVKLLIKNKANPYIKGFDDASLSDMVSYSMHPDIAKLLEAYMLQQ